VAIMISRAIGVVIAASRVSMADLFLKNFNLLIPPRFLLEDEQKDCDGDADSGGDVDGR